MRVIVLVFFVLLGMVHMVPATGNFAAAATPKPTSSPVYKTVDSLNEQAFYEKRQNLEKALELLHSAAVLASEHEYTKGQAINALYEAGIFIQNGYAKRALSLYYKSLELSRSIQDTFNIARANQQLANALAEGDEPAKAEQLYLQALEEFRQLGRTDDAINIKNNLGLLKHKQNYSTMALAYLLQAQQESERANYTYGLKKAHFHQGLVYLEQNRLAEAEKHFLQALAIDQRTGDRYGMSLVKGKLAIIACHRSDYAKAVALGEDALSDAQAISAEQLAAEAVEVLIKVYKSQGNFERIAYWQGVLVAQQKELFEHEKNYALNFLDILKQKQEEQLLSDKAAMRAEQNAKRTNYMLLVVSLILVLLIVLALVRLRFYRKLRTYSLELEEKNRLIQHNAAQLDALNQTMQQQNSSLEEANQLKNKLFSIISHDLRGPLSSVKGVLDLLLNKNYSEAEGARILSLMRKEMEGVMALLHNLLLWSKAQLAGEEVELLPTDLHNLISENLALATGIAQQKNITIYNEVSPGTLALADRERLSFVLRNLLMNALKFTYEGGEVRVRAEVRNSMLALSVQDNGKGIAAADLNKLFSAQRFTTLGTAKEKGTGLGLMLSKDFVESMNGSIQVSSLEGEGTTFYVLLKKTGTAVEIAPASVAAI